jgi:GNAT superfamily N-acetyltransferase
MSAIRLPLALNQAFKAPPDYVFYQEQPERYPLVDRFYRRQGYKVKVAANESLFVMYNTAAQIDRDTQSASAEMMAAARLVPQSSGHFWLRNLLVAKEHRAKGVASALMQQLLPLIAPQGCYCFALPHLEVFYKRLGFALQPDHCPDDIQQKYQQYRAKGRDWLLMGYKAI